MRQFPERGREATQPKGELCSNVLIYYFFPAPEESRSCCVRAGSVFQVSCRFAHRYRTRRAVLSMVPLGTRCRSVLCPLCPHGAQFPLGPVPCWSCAPRLCGAVGTRASSLK